MTQDHSSKLSFSIEESVWLNKGQEVEEIISLSLDPEITVQEHGEYVLIRGGLKLTGQYRSSSVESQTAANESLVSQVAFRSIQEVTLNEDGTGEIKHHFPIDVTIPQERIRSLDDIYVIVESFDYDLPERGCIQLTADISISGMSTGTSTQRAVANEIEQVEQVEEIQEVEIGEIEEVQEKREFHFEAYEQQEVEEEVEEVVEEETVVQFPTEEIVGQREDEVIEKDIEEEISRYEEVELAEPEVELPERKSELLELEADEQQVEVAQQPETKVVSPAVAFGVVKERPSIEEEATVKNKQQSPSFSIAKSINRPQQKQAAKEDATQAKAKQQNNEEAKTPREENALYLTKMLTKAEGEQFKKLKLCIIRQNETLDTIAARYEITQSTLIKINRLNDATVKEGQILYIPVSK